MAQIKTYPTLMAVISANHYQICKWYRFLRSPETQEEVDINNEICERLKNFGGFTPEISKSIGWE
ncbi:MAG: hypothetical protein WC415_04160 [Patescibacteria group bacterium]|jgi:hypothetical protein